jgi:aryl-alcohol dehydrogenase
LTLTNHFGAKIHKIQAAVIREPGSLLIEALEMECPREDEVLVHLKATGICHTDIDFCDDWRGPPAVLGHEGAGTVAEVGKKITAVKPGDHVVLSYQSCGQCRPCRDGHPVHCENFWEANFGFARLDGSNQAMADARQGDTIKPVLRISKE